MYREEFIDNVTTWSELKAFCYDEDCDICEDIYPEEERDDAIDNGKLYEWASSYSWQELYDILSNIPVGWDYYREDGYGDWYGADDVLFEERKQEVIEWMDNGGYWEEEYNEEETLTLDDDCEEADEEEDLKPIETESIPFMDLLISCSNKLGQIEYEQEKETLEEEKKFDSFTKDMTRNLCEKWSSINV